MKTRLALAALLLSHSIRADTSIYECEMSVAETKNGTVTNIVKALRSNGSG